jgi:putative transposase
LKRNGKLDYRFRPGTDYAYQCFQYIHQNPVDAGLVQRTIDYPWSSARDYAGLRKGSLCNLELGRQLIENF